MLIKSTSLSLIITALFTLLTGTPALADAPAELASPYKLNSILARIPQPTSLKPNTAFPLLPRPYQLEYKFRSPITVPKKIQAGLPTAPVVADAILIESPVIVQTEGIPGKFTPEKLANEKLYNQPFSKEIALAASAALLDPALVHAVIYVESHYRHLAVSPKGAIGLMQVLPGTAARYGINPSQSRKANLKAGTLYLRDLMRLFDNRIDLVLAAYNAGEGAVMKQSMRVPPYRETRLYVVAVMAKYNEWRNDRSYVQNPVATDNEESLAPAEPVKPEYMAGTRLASSETEFAPKY